MVDITRIELNASTTGLMTCTADRPSSSSDQSKSFFTKCLKISKFLVSFLTIYPHDSERVSRDFGKTQPTIFRKHKENKSSPHLIYFPYLIQTALSSIGQKLHFVCLHFSICACHKQCLSNRIHLNKKQKETSVTDLVRARQQCEAPLANNKRHH